MKTHPVKAELFPANGHTAMRKLKASFRKFAQLPKKVTENVEFRIIRYYNLNRNWS
jgi:hypothetical protein